MPIRCFESMDSLNPDFMKEWRLLVHEGGNRTPFSDPLWLQAWWSVYGFDQQLFLLAVYEGDALLGVFPLMREKRRFHERIHWVGYPESTHAGFTIRSGQAEKVLREMIGYLFSQPFSFLLFGTGLQMNSTELNLFKSVLEELRIPSLLLPSISPVIQKGTPPYEEFYRTRFSSHNRKNHRKDLQRLSSIGKVSYRDLAQEEMDEAFSLHEQRWKEKWDTSRFTEQKSRILFQSLLESKENDLKEDWQAFALGLYLDDRMIGFQYGFWNRDKALFYKSAHDPHYNAMAPGKMIKRECVKRCYEKGISSIDLGVGFEEYKAEWTDDQTPIYRLLVSNGDFASRLMFHFCKRRALIINRLKQSRRLVLFKRNTLGRLRYRLRLLMRGVRRRE